MDLLITLILAKQRRKLRVRKAKCKYAGIVMQQALLYRKRLYLKERNFLHSAALFNSVVEAPWYKMYRDGSDSDFVTATSLTRASFEYLLIEFKKHYVFHSGPTKSGRPSRVKDHHCVLSLLLHRYCSPAENKTWSEMFGITPSTLIRTLAKGEAALLRTLNNLPEARVEWPSKEEQVAMAIKVQTVEPIILGRWGFIDGKNYRVAEPANCLVQNAMYNGWLHSVFVTGTACFSVQGVIIWAKLNFFGSWNDSEMSREFMDILSDSNRNEDGHGVLSDSAFPVSSHMFGRIMTPLKDGDLSRAHRDARPALMHLSAAITSMRQSAEWGMGAVCKVYRILNNKLSFDCKKRGQLLTVLHKLYNYRVRTTGISQIKNYFNA